MPPGGAGKPIARSTARLKPLGRACQDKSGGERRLVLGCVVAGEIGRNRAAGIWSLDDVEEKHGGGDISMAGRFWRVRMSAPVLAETRSERVADGSFHGRMEDSWIIHRLYI